MDSVSKSYNGEKVLDQVSLEIAEGERIVLLGASGCGKTTLLRLIAGFIVPDVGSISIAGELAARDGRIFKQPEQRNLGMVFQDLALWPHLSVKGNIDFGLKAKGLPKAAREERIKAVLDLVGLTDFTNKKPGELSGGQQQRVALARVLVLEPEVILMDEPLSSLDAELKVRLWKEIIQLQEKIGFTLLYVTHDEREAIEIATRVLRIENGQVDSGVGHSPNPGSIG
ncbi:MAG: ABC transporter ATP-binding protein [Candidatus Krumholzibacteria bacterium]|nr:ABC transporter ATP-binding protein [Candidatus Krumholzibacteria bacterium]